MNRWGILIIAVTVLLWWWFGLFDNIFSEYQRRTNYYAMIINNEQDYNNFCGNVTRMINTGDIKFAGGYSGCGFMEFAYHNKKTNILYFWE